MSTTSFGELLRRLRSTAALSQEALAERAGLSRNAISELERGLHPAPRLETARLLADALTLSEPDRTALLAAARPALSQAATATPSSAYLSSLSTPPTRLIGRENELATLTVALRNEAVRLLTLTGPGGVGKTRLALSVASLLSAEFPDGITFVELAPITDPKLVPSVIALALGVRETGEDLLIDRLRAVLREKRSLLVLDNFEQVVNAAPVVAALAAACPALTVLVTSRMRLRLSIELEFPVGPLALPDGGDVSPAEDLASAAAVQLFVARAQAVAPTFALTKGNAVAVSAICHRLDGLPLALELAAARIKILPPAALLARLDQRLSLLSGGGRDLPARQQTMREAIAWSYALLTPEQQALFRGLAVFSGGFTDEAAAAIVGNQADAGIDVLDTIGVLVDASLVKAEAVGDEPRFSMYETIRDYALEQLVANGEEETTRERHARWYLSLVIGDGAATRLIGDLVRMRRLAIEHQNLRAALSWFTRTGDTESLSRLAGPLWQFWGFAGLLIEGRAWLEQAVASSGVSWATRQLTLAGAAHFAILANDHGRARTLGEEMLRLASDNGDRAGEASANFMLSRVANQQESYAEAMGFAIEAVSLFREFDNNVRLAWAVNRLGIEMQIAGDLVHSEILFVEALERFRAADYSLGTRYALTNLGMTQRALGDRRQAAVLFRESLSLRESGEDPWETAVLLEFVAALAVDAGATEQAARLFGASVGMYELSGSHPQPYERAMTRPAEAEARILLGADRFAAAWETGKTWSYERAVEEALAVVATIAGCSGC